MKKALKIKKPNRQRKMGHRWGGGMNGSGGSGAGSGSVASRRYRADAKIKLGTSRRTSSEEDK